MQAATRHKIPRMSEPSPALTRRDFLQVAGAGIAFGAMPHMPSALRAEGGTSSTFAVRFDAGAIVSLKRVDDAFDTDYVQRARRLGDVVVRYRRGNGAWESFETAASPPPRVERSADGTHSRVAYTSPDESLQLGVEFIIGETAIDWRINLENQGSSQIEIGDLAVPLAMNSDFRQQPETAVLKHGLISGHGSFLFWMRRNSVGPYLTMTPSAGTSLEYWEAQEGYRVFMHSAVAGAAARERGTKWRQPNTSAVIQPHATKRYGFKLQWAPDYQGVRDGLVREGFVDTHIVPGMTVPRDLSARVALRSSSTIHSVSAEFPGDTSIRALGRTGDAELYEVRF